MRSYTPVPLRAGHFGANAPLKKSVESTRLRCVYEIIYAAQLCQNGNGVQYSERAISRGAIWRATLSHGLMKDRMAYVGDVPWHGLGNKVSPTIDALGMIREAGLDWRVWKQPAPGARLVPRGQAIYDKYMVMRDPTPEEAVPVALGFVGGGYQELQNHDAFRFFEPFIDEGYAQFHTAGALDNGQRVWVMAKLKEQIIVGGNDAIDRYLLLSNSHDGSSAVSVSFTPVRVVCQNTLNLARKDRKSAIAIPHTRNLARGMAKAQAEQLKTVFDQVFSRAGDLFGQLAAFQIEGRTDNFLERLFPRTERMKKDMLERGKDPFEPENDTLEPERWTRIKSVLDDKRVTPVESRNTLWALYNAVVYDEDYRESREAGPEARLSRIWFGSGQALKIKALEEAEKFAKAAA